MEPLPFSLEGKTVFVAGHRGMVGRALLRRLESENVQILTATREELDLTKQNLVSAWTEKYRPEIVIIAAAKVGGIWANDRFPVDFLLQNLQIGTNLIEAAYRADTQKLLFLGSSCIYPKLAPQPLEEKSLLAGPLEPTNQWYAIAKIACIKLCEAYRRQFGVDFISAVPANLYGPFDNFDLETSHVLPALIRKFHEAKASGAERVEIWGSGKARREFLHVDDLADACIHLLKNYGSGVPVNIGYGDDVTIRELAKILKLATGFDGDLYFDLSMPDGTPQKILDNKLIEELGWEPSIGFEHGLSMTYSWYLSNLAKSGMHALP